VDAITYSAARENLADTMDSVCDNHEPVIITRRNSRSVVMMSLEDFNSIAETAYLLRSPSNSERLRESIKQAESGEVVIKELIAK
jgi:antitoxin YefM